MSRGGSEVSSFGGGVASSKIRRLLLTCGLDCGVWPWAESGVVGTGADLAGEGGVGPWGEAGVLSVGTAGKSFRYWSMTSFGAGLRKGTYFLRNFLFLTVTLPDPSTFTTYWSNCLTSITLPVLSHLRAWGPTWFWMRTRSPTANGGSLMVCSDQRSASLM